MSNRARGVSVFDVLRIGGAVAIAVGILMLPLPFSAAWGQDVESDPVIQEDAEPAPDPAADPIDESSMVDDEEALREAAQRERDLAREEARRHRDEQRDLKREERDRAVRRDAQVSFGSNVVVEEDEIARDVISIGGSVLVKGEVLGNAVAIGGPLHVEGTVSDTAIAVGNSVHLGSDAVVGDVVSVGGRVRRESGAQVHGDINEIAIGQDFRIGWWPFDWGRGGSYDLDDFYFSPFEVVFDVFWGVVCMLIMILFASGFLLVARQPFERVGRKLKEDPFQAALVGFLAQVLCGPFFVLVVLILVISIIGIPLLILLPIAILGLLIAAFMGYAAVAYRLGSWLKDRFGWHFVDNPYLALTAGVVLLQMWSLIADVTDLGHGPLWFLSIMLGVFGFIVQYVAWTAGLGAVLLTRFGTSNTWRRQAPVAAAPTGPPAAQAPIESPVAPPSISHEPPYRDPGPQMDAGDDPESPPPVTDPTHPEDE